MNSVSRGGIIDRSTRARRLGVAVGPAPAAPSVVFAVGPSGESVLAIGALLSAPRIEGGAPRGGRCGAAAPALECRDERHRRSGGDCCDEADSIVADFGGTAAESPHRDEGQGGLRGVGLKATVLCYAPCWARRATPYGHQIFRGGPPARIFRQAACDSTRHRAPTASASSTARRLSSVDDLRQRPLHAQRRGVDRRKRGVRPCHHATPCMASNARSRVVARAGLLMRPAASASRASLARRTRLRALHAGRPDGAVAAPAALRGAKGPRRDRRPFQRGHSR